MIKTKYNKKFLVLIISLLITSLVIAEELETPNIIVRYKNHEEIRTFILNLSSDMETILEEVKQFLNVKGKININIYLISDPINFAYHKDGTIYIDPNYVRKGILVHEMTHAVIYYLRPDIPLKSREIICRKAEKHIKQKEIIIKID